MFVQVPCSYQGCENGALSSQLTCFDHLPDRARYLGELRDFLRSTVTIRDMTLPLVALEGFDLSERRFFVCNFSGARFKDVILRNSLFKLCFFDYVELTDCNCTGVELRNCAAPGARIEGCDFRSSNLVQVNFNGARCTRVTFDSSDLYNSRFLGAELREASFVDCNLKNVDFSRSLQYEVNFKYSNDEDAIFDGVRRGTQP